MARFQDSAARLSPLIINTLLTPHVATHHSPVSKNRPRGPSEAQQKSKLGATGPNHDWKSNQVKDVDEQYFQDHIFYYYMMYDIKYII